MTDYYGRSSAEDEIARQIPINKRLKQLLDSMTTKEGVHVPGGMLVADEASVVIVNGKVYTAP